MKEILFKGIKDVKVEEKETPKLEKGFIRVKHIYSLVSAGTECLKLEGKMGKVENSSVGYSGVGMVVDGMEGTSFNLGDFVFTRERHADIVDVPHNIAEKQFIKVDKEFAKEATFLELGKVAMHGLHRVEVKIGDWIIVFGLGIVGNLAAQLARLATGKKVIGVEPIMKRRSIAESLGITTIDPREKEFVRKIMNLTDNNGVEICLETSGSQQALNQAMEISSLRGQISIIAGHYGIRELDLKTHFQNKELSLIGARRLELTEKSMEDRWTVTECKKEIYRMIKWKDIQVDPLITHVVKPEEAPEVYKSLLNKDESMLGVIFSWDN